MQKISLSQALPGMALDREVHRPANPDGVPICGRGVILTEELIDRLQKLGVQTVTVEGNPLGVDGGKVLMDMLAQLDKRFKKVESKPLMMKLKDIYRKRIIRSMGE